MIRRDYILRMIEEFTQALARIKLLKQAQDWQAASRSVEEEFRKLIGADPITVAQLSETELLAKIMLAGPTQSVHDRTLMVTALLKDAGDVAAAQERTEESRAFYLKGLHVLLQTLAQNEIFDWPDFVPQVEVFLAALSDSPLPLPTQAMVMQHCERTGEFAKAEDALFSMLELEPANTGLIEFGVSFYQRLQNQSDASLETGNLPRAELKAGLAKLLENSKSSGNSNIG